MINGPRMAAHLGVPLPFLGMFCPRASKRQRHKAHRRTGVLSNVSPVNWQAETVYCSYRR